jgi:hypothetical protein
VLSLSRAEGDSSSEQATQQVGSSACGPAACFTPANARLLLHLLALKDFPAIWFLLQTAPASQQQQQREEEPVWVQRERERKLQKEEGGGDLPFGAYLLFSAFTAIAAVRCGCKFMKSSRPSFHAALANC